MNEAHGNIYKNARIRTGLKREPAAEELHIDVRTLDKYESIGGKPPEEIVRSMCLLYNDRHLGYLHIKQSPLGEFLPDYSPNSFGHATLSMVNDFQQVDKIILDIVKIASDGNIDKGEQDDWSQIRGKVLGLIGALMSVVEAGEVSLKRGVSLCGIRSKK